MLVLLPASVLLLLQCAVFSTSAPLATPTAQPSKVFPTLDDRDTSYYDQRPASSETTPAPNTNQAVSPVNYAAGVQLGSLLPGVGVEEALSSISKSSTSRNSTRTTPTTSSTKLLTGYLPL